MTEDGLPPLAAGDFSVWLAGMKRALAGGRGTDVPCDGCTACCTSSQFVHIGPDEADTLAHVPAELLFPAPRRPSGHVLLGYDEHGRCPMLGDGGCSIYDHRPRTCRTYDCRVLPAAGIELDGGDKPAIAGRARRWRFDHPDEIDQVEHDAVRAAARFVRERPDRLPVGDVPTTATQRAVLAVEIADAFIAHDHRTGRSVVVDPRAEAIEAILTKPPDLR